MRKYDYTYYVYILTNKKNGVLYVGMTNNLERRLYEHKKGNLTGFTQKYHLTKLVYAEFHKYVNDAIYREKQIKNWQRAWKIQLIEEENEDWIDLAAEWY